MQSEQNATKNEANDHVYFAIVPRIVWALSRNPYDETLWKTVKDIAGDAGECYIGTEDLATLAMMSVGQIYDSRQYLISCGLLEGEVRRDPGYQQPVWHLRTPDLWAKNLEWCQKHPKIKDRIAFKAAQKERIEQERKAQKERLEQQKKTAESLHQVKGSPGEKGTTPGEKAPLPGETKNIYKENQEEKPVIGAQPAPAAPEFSPEPTRRTAAHVQGDAMDGILHFAAQGADPQVALTARVSEYPEDCQQTLLWLVELFQWPLSAIPVRPTRSGKGGSYAQWINEIRDINHLISGHGKLALEAAEKACKQITVSHPAGITWCLPGEIGKLSKKTSQTSVQREQTPLEKMMQPGSWTPLPRRSLPKSGTSA